MSTCRHDSMLKVQPTSGLTHSIQIHLMLCMDVEILLGIIFFPSCILLSPNLLSSSDLLTQAM